MERRFTLSVWFQMYRIWLLEDLVILSIVLMDTRDMPPVIMDTQTNKILTHTFSYMVNC